MIVECYIHAQDRSRINIGDPAKVAISGVNQTKYGLLKGEVVSIGSGSITQNSGNQENQLLYEVIIKLKTTSLKSDNKIITGSPSMPVVANIIYDKETYLEWTLEHLNFTK